MAPDKEIRELLALVFCFIFYAGKAKGFAPFETGGTASAMDCPTLVARPCQGVVDTKTLTTTGDIGFGDVGIGCPYGDVGVGTIAHSC